MCQRYALPDQLAAEREFLPATAWWKFATRFNVAAEQYVPAIRLHQRETEGIMMRWGLIPAWFKAPPGTAQRPGSRRPFAEFQNLPRRVAGQPALHPAGGRVLPLAVDAGEIPPAFFRTI
jgi:putative SOS response-associated peptidase YedK